MKTGSQAAVPHEVPGKGPRGRISAGRGSGEGKTRYRPFLMALGTRTGQNMGSVPDAPGKFQKVLLYRMGAG